MSKSPRLGRLFRADNDSEFGSPLIYEGNAVSCRLDMIDQTLEVIKGKKNNYKL